jgi:hypothetical protein
MSRTETARRQYQEKLLALNQKVRFAPLNATTRRNTISGLSRIRAFRTRAFPVLVAFRFRNDHERDKTAEAVAVETAVQAVRAT